MRIITLFAVILGFLASFLVATPASAQLTQSWVSGVGDDANPCFRTAPCKTFAGAIAKTGTGGQINCLDPGGFGAVTITISITIDCHEVYGSVLVFATNGININAPGGVVTLRNLNFDGFGSGLSAINIVAATTVNVEDVMIMGFTKYGVADTRTGGGTFLSVKNTTVRNVSISGIAIGGSGNSVVVDKVHSVRNAYGIAIGNGNSVMANRSVFSLNSTAGVETDVGARLNVDNSVINNNGTGVIAGGTIRLANSDIAFNTTGISGAPLSFGNNRISGNGSAGNAPVAAGGASTELGQQ
jgi:hypothetical protein